MKKIIAGLLTVSLLLLCGCANTNVTPESFEIASLKGPTSMGLVSLMEKSEGEEYSNDYNVTVYGTADEFVSAFSSGEIAVANIPCNLASVLYNRTEGKIRVAAVNTLGVLYMISTGNVSSVEDLRGKTIYTTGKGTTPEYVLSYVLSQNGLTPGEDITVEFLSEATEVAARLSAGETDVVAMLPQPYVTVVTTQNPDYSISLDMNEEWEKVSGGTPIVTGVVAVYSDFYEANPAAFELFLSDYADSVEFAGANIAEAASLIEKYGIINAVVAEKALPYCNITLLTGDELVSSVSAYLQVLYDFNPQSVGGAIPNEDFYI